MTTQAGLWIDHRKAVIVTITDAGHATRSVESNAERHVRYTTGSHPGRSERSRPESSEDSRDRHFEDELDRYYDDVIANIGDAEAILIFGPGEAKGELRARLELDGLGARVVGVETVDRMTDPQIVAKVRQRLEP